MVKRSHFTNTQNKITGCHFLIHLISKGYVVFKCRFKPELSRGINYCHVQTIKVI